MRWRVLTLVAVSVVLAACQPGAGSDGGNASPSRTRSATSTPASPSESPTRAPDLTRARIRLEEVAVLEQPIAIAVRPGDDALYVAEKIGKVVALRDRGSRQEVVLDITDDVSLGGEQGLLGLAFSPDGEFLYVSFTDVSGNSHVTEFGFGDDGSDVSSRRDVLTVAQPFSNHNGGNIAFGPDGYLYIGFGDGGSGGDPMGNGQSLSTLLGKMLRISPRPSDGDPYGIPPDNPFVGREGARPEIWAYGLRNPWRWSFDRETGDLWIGDVGQDIWEEIDVEPAGSGGGLNYGWNRFEATHPYLHAGSRKNIAMPVYEYPHGGCAVTGGYVYRGREIPDLVGAYVFGDFCTGTLEAFVLRDGRTKGRRSLEVGVENLASFGEDAAGELYALSLSGPVYRLARASS